MLYLLQLIINQIPSDRLYSMTQISEGQLTLRVSGQSIQMMSSLSTRTIIKHKNIVLKENCGNNSQYTIMMNGMRKEKKKRTPNDLLKENLLKTRLSRRKSKLQKITESNVKLFQRIQSQKSVYAAKRVNRSRTSSQNSVRDTSGIKQSQKTSVFDRSQITKRSSSASQLRVKLNTQQNVKMVSQHAKQINLEDLHQFKKTFVGLSKQNQGIQNFLLNQLTLTERSKELSECQQKSRGLKCAVNRKINENNRFQAPSNQIKSSKMILHKMY